MAQRRMFSKAIVNSEEFSVMPKSSQALYFHLGMEADDDGFIHPGQVMRSGGFQEDDLKILLAKRFLLAFDTGVVVIKHWLIHNLIQKDRHLPSRYQEELKTLFIKENKAYTERKPISEQPVNKVLTQVRLGKDRLGKVSLENTAETAGFKDEVNLIFETFYKTINPQINFGRKDSRDAALWLITKYGFEMTLKAAEYACKVFSDQYAPSIKTPAQLKDKWANLVKFKMKDNKAQESHLSL